jgi:membrane-associated phospholipid phosphatase
MNIVEIIQVIKALINTFVRFLPIGLYSFAYLSVAILKDKRAGLLLLGLVLNDIIGYILKRYYNYEDNENCATFGGVGDEKTLGFFPNSHTEIMAFVATFYYSDMWYKYVFDFIPFFFILALLVLTVYSRLVIGCETVKDALINIVMGFIRGVIYFYIIAKFYREAELEMQGGKECDLGYQDYQCNEIQDGKVIIKQPKKEKTEEEKNEEVYQGWYD